LALPLALRLRSRRGLRDADLDDHLFVATPAPGSRVRRCIAVVDPDRHPDIGLVGADRIRRIERDPAERRYPGLGPGVPGVLDGGAIAPEQVTGDVAGGDAAQPRRGDEDVREVLANSASPASAVVSGVGRRKTSFGKSPDSPSTTPARSSVITRPAAVMASSWTGSST
jgi:hypothetical protein